jgi:hypothetical protein
MPLAWSRATWALTQSYVARRPSTSRVDGDHPSRSLISSLLLLRPLCVRVRVCVCA